MKEWIGSKCIYVMGYLIGSMLSDYAATPVAPVTLTLTQFEQDMIDAVNNERAAHNLPPYSASSPLLQAARTHTLWMLKHRRMVHSGGPYGENIAMGQRDIRQVMQSWMNSSGHRAAILNRNYKYIGCTGYVDGGAPYWCQCFR